MACRRCGGFMILESILSCLEESASSDSHRTRCLNCGNIEDSVIWLNKTVCVSAKGPLARA